MTTSRKNVRTLNFENAGATGALLGYLGLETNVATFLIDHLDSVLRRQHNDLEIESIEFLAANESSLCNIDGVKTADPNIVIMNTLRMPIDVDLIITTRNERRM